MVTSTPEVCPLGLLAKRALRQPELNTSFGAFCGLSVLPFLQANTPLRTHTHTHKSARFSPWAHVPPTARVCAQVAGWGCGAPGEQLGAPGTEACQPNQRLLCPTGPLVSAKVCPNDF